MRIALIVVGVLVALILVIVIIGAFVPRHHTASRTMRYNRTPAEVYAAVRDFESFPKWRGDVARVEMLNVTPHVQFREHASHGAVTYEVVEDAPPRKLVTRIVDRDLGYSGSWTYEVSPAPDGGAELKITEDGEVSNLFFRFMARFVFGYTATMEKYQNDLLKNLSA